MSLWRRVVFGSLIRAAALGAVGGVIVTAALGAQAYWGRGLTLDLFGARAEQPAAPAEYLLGRTLLGWTAGLFTLAWAWLGYSSWVKAGPDGHAEPGAAADGGA